MKNLRSWSARLPLRDWQRRAVDVFHSLGKTDALFVGTPGGGKTFFALKCAHDLMSAGKVERLVVVTPTNHLRRQWAEASARCGIDVDPHWSNSNGVEAKDYSGVAVTYQQVSYAPDLYDLNCRRKTLVILDEVHHAGDNLDWGEKLRAAFRAAAYRLSLSGTPFRNDNQPIPFVAYEDNRSRADFVYGYGDALRDGVCRPIYFPTMEGDVSWLRGNGAIVNCSMLDNVSKTVAAERLRAALDANGNWMKTVLREADARLSQMRCDGHGDAAGLVIAADQQHARQIAVLLKSFTGESVALAISDEENSSNVIREFARTGNNQKWIVAVKMVSEGVDIPRLRVGVFATTVQSELFFRQAVGRFVRALPGIEEQSAALFLPADRKLISHALAIKEEREHYLRSVLEIGDDRFSASKSKSEGIHEHPTNEIQNRSSSENFSDNTVENKDESNYFDEDSCKNNSEDGNVALQSDALNAKENPTAETVFAIEASNFQRGFIVPLGAEARAFDTIFNGVRFSCDELERAEAVGKDIGLQIPAAQVAAILRRGAGESANNTMPVETQILRIEPEKTEIGREKKENSNACNPFTGVPQIASAAEVFPNSPLKADRKVALKRQINRLANRLARQLEIEFGDVHRYWKRELNGVSHADATEEDLRKKFGWLVECIENRTFTNPKLLFINRSLRQ